MDIRHQQLGAADKLAVLLSFDGAHSDLAALVHIKAVGLPCVHFGVGRAVAHQRTLADLRIDSSWDKEGDVDVVVFQFQRFIKTKQGMLGGAIGRAQREAEQTR